jgi:hypothetical protein
MKPGDFILTQDSNPISELIMAGEQGSFAHSGIVVGANKLVEALGNGVVENPINYRRYAVFEVIGITDEQREGVVSYARSQIGDKYGFLQDIGFAINGLIELAGHERIPHLLAEQGKPVCSALTDLAFRSKRIVIREDREAGDITPQGLSYSTKVRMIENHNLWEL